MLEKQTKEKLIKKYGTHDKDTGSPQVQIAILTEEIKDLTDHLKTHKKDHSSRRGLLKKIGERKKLLKYLKKENEEEFNNLAKKLNLKIAKKIEEEEEKKQQMEKMLEEKEQIPSDSDEDESENEDDDDKKTKGSEEK